MPAAQSAPPVAPRRDTRAGSRRASGRASLAALTVAGVAWLATAGDVRAQPTPFGVEPLVVEGDVLVAPAGFRGVGVAPGERLWAYGEVPYTVDVALDERASRAIEEAVERWNEVSGVTLVAVAPGVDPPPDHLHFQSGPGCASWVGRQGGRQAVWIGPSCTRGSVMHEIGHALGLEHEHTRPDRDAHVRVLWDNIVPEKRHNFAVAPAGTRAYGDYDVGSIMHYGPTNFSIDGGPTLEALDPGHGTVMGQRDTPSAGDIAAVARLYASDLVLAIGVEDERAAREITLFVTNDHSQGAHDVTLTLRRTDGGDLVPSSGERPAIVGDAGWDCVPSVDRVDCRRARLAGHASSRVVVTLADALDVAAVGATLASKTPDLDPANNADGAAADPRPALAAALSGDAAAVADDADDADDAGRTVVTDAAAGDVGGGAFAPAALVVLVLLGAVRRRAAAGTATRATGAERRGRARY